MYKTTHDQTTARRVSAKLGAGIIFMPYVFSWFTFRKGHSRISQVLSLTWLGVFVIANTWVTSVKPITAATDAGNDSAIVVPVASPTPLRTLLPPADSWASKESRDACGALFIKPYIRKWLKDPDSLQDFEVIDATPVKHRLGTFKVTVFYRARNAFGALVPERRTVTMVFNPVGDDLHRWMLSR